MKQSNVYSKYFAAMLLVLTLAATAATAQEKAAAPGGMAGGVSFGSGAAGPIGAGDLIEMSVFDTPELSGKLRVSNTGDISLPLVGSLHVAGLKADDVQSLIRRKFIDGGFLKDPQVTVFVAEYATQGVSVLGEVKSPGIYPAFGSHHLLDYISVAGGLTPLAGTTITITRVGHPDAPENVKISASAASKPLNNPEILPGDSIFVERTGLIYVIGEVVRPGGFPMDHDQHLTILQAIALAQGTSYTAAKGSAKIIRTTLQGRQEIPVNLKNILAAKAPDEPLQDNDILFVPSSATKATLKNMESLLPVAASATIYRIP
ncbi:MAG TPA: polysaccharide biosynthesis/export family protein [Terriglobales bacterium]|nr:polysaccharide biosynthesis/export family protein [Terriglobales bacterium]